MLFIDHLTNLLGLKEKFGWNQCLVLIPRHGTQDERKGHFQFLKEDLEWVRPSP